MSKKFFHCIYALFIPICLVYSSFAQIDPSRYIQADSIQKLAKLVYFTELAPHWIGELYVLWYTTNTRQGTQYFLVRAEDQTKIEAFDHQRLADSLEIHTGNSFDPFDLSLDDLQFDTSLQVIRFSKHKVRWKCDLENYHLTKLEELKEEERVRRYWGEGRDELGNEPEISPDSQWTAYVRDYNVFIRAEKDKKEFPLSYDGNSSHYYSSYIEWSPDSRKLATFKVRDVDRRIIQFVEAAPDDQLQPKLHNRSYLKPGDVVPVYYPALFHVDGQKQVPLETSAYLDQYSVNRLDWRESSDAFTFEYNQRGHQLYQVVEVNAATGKSHVVIEERSNTFIDYSGKRYRHDLDKTQQVIWASERDGWNHLYLIDAPSGKVSNQITKGPWVVRDVLHVDEENGRILFAASGRNQDEDPYFLHYYWISFDGTGLTSLTPEPANHRVTFSDDYTFFVDVYSRVDLAPKAVLRSGKTGKILMTLEEGDISELLATGWQKPEVFVAKGRDGETDIWGNVYRPTHYDSNKEYPLIEYIYAGPHSSFVQKSFHPVHRAISGIAELGFIVVQLDGMGTSNRSKGFHNVCWRNLKDAGFPDRKIWIRALAEKYPNIDISNVGIYGTSAGGQSSMAALLWHADLYKVAVSSCGCHDNRMDKIWWNEQWMGYPIGQHYSENSNVDNAHMLEGRLMLLVGEVDDNVDPASTMQVADALIKAGKDFELVVLPGMNHTSGGEYGERKRRDFFVKHILGFDPPDWNKLPVAN